MYYILDNLGGQKCFSKLDMCKAYHQGFMDKKSQDLTTFISPWRLYKWLLIPFGLCSVLSAFQRSMNQCLSGLRYSICIFYLDDILCCDKSFDKHLENLQTILKQLKQFGVKLSAEKCVIFRSEVKYRGETINVKRYKDDGITTEVVEKIFKKTPKAIGYLRKLLDFC